MEERIEYFDSLEKAERFIKAHNIKFFHYQTSKQLGKLLALVIEKTFFVKFVVKKPQFVVKAVNQILVLCVCHCQRPRFRGRKSFFGLLGKFIDQNGNCP